MGENHLIEVLHKVEFIKMIFMQTFKNLHGDFVLKLEIRGILKIVMLDYCRIS